MADLAIVKYELAEGKQYQIMTTSHPNESLSEALWFLLNVADPDDTYFEKCESCLVIAVGNPAWDAEVAYWLTNPNELDSYTE